MLPSHNPLQLASAPVVLAFNTAGCVIVAVVVLYNRLHGHRYSICRCCKPADVLSCFFAPKYEYGKVPPLTVSETEPSFPPLQLTFVVVVESKVQQPVMITESFLATSYYQQLRNRPAEPGDGLCC